MERAGHHAVGRVEGFLDAVAVVDVDVDVEDSRVESAAWVKFSYGLEGGGRETGPKELQDGENDVVDVAEPARLTLLGVVQTSSPVDGDVSLARRDPSCST